MTRALICIISVFALTASTCSTSKPVVSPAAHTEARDEAIHLGAIGASCVVTLQQNDVTVATQTADATGTVNLVVTMRYDAAGNPLPGTLNLHATANCPTDAQPEQPWDVRWVAAVHGNQDVCAGGSSCGPNQGLIVAPMTPPSQSVHLQGTQLRTADGAIYHVRRVTAMDLLATDQTTFLDWALATGFNEVRVLTEAAITANLPAAAGEAAIPSLCANLRTRHMGAELVANVDTAALGQDDAAIHAHTRAVAQAVAASCADIPIEIEICNECANTGSGGQSSSLQSQAFVSSLYAGVKAIVPSVPVALGSPCCGQPDTVPIFTGGDYITEHLDRSRTPFWDEVRRIKDFYDESATYHLAVADDEGMGAGEADEPGRRSANPARFFVQGVLDRLGDLPSTFHCADCVYARVPGRVQQACAMAFVAGATAVPDAAVFQFYNDTIGDAATNGGNWSHVEKLFTFVNVMGGQSYVVALNVTGDPGITWRGGWRQTGQVDTTTYPGIGLLEIAR